MMRRKTRGTTDAEAAADQGARNRAGKADKEQDIVAAIKKDPGLTNAQLVERFRVPSGYLTRLRERHGLPKSPSFPY